MLRDLYTCSGLHLAGSAGLRAARTLRCMKYRPYARLRTPLIGFKMVKAQAIANSQGRARLHRASLSGATGRKVAAHATRKCPDLRALSNHITAGSRRIDKSHKQTAVANLSIGEGGTHRPDAELCTASQGFSLRLGKAEPGRRAQRGSTLINVLSAVYGPKTVASSVGRAGEQLPQSGPRVKPALIGQAQSRARLHRASLSG